MWNFDPDEPTLRAIHEASHAVIMAACGCPFVHVGMWRASVTGWTGLCPPHVSLKKKIRIPRSKVAKSIDLIDLDVVMILAGPVSESKHMNTKLELERWEYSEDLRSIIYRMRDILELSYDLHSPYLNGLVRVTKKLLDKKWEAILNVATILDRDDRMMYDAVLRNAQPEFSLDMLKTMVCEERPSGYRFQET